MTENNGENEMTLEEYRNYERHWHLNKSVPVALIIVLLANIITFTWYASKLDGRVTHNESAIKSSERAIRANANMSERVARVEEQLKFTNQYLYDIKAEMVALRKNLSRGK